MRTTLESSTAGKESNKRPFPFSAPCYVSTTSLGESVKTQSLSTACELCEHPSSATDAGRNKRLHSQQLFNHHPRPLPQVQLRMLCYTVLRITLQASTKSKLRATHIHHGQVSNMIKDISNTVKCTTHNNAGKQTSYVNTQHHVTAWTVTVGSPQNPLF